MVKLELNNFKSFDQCLFGDFEPDWSKFYDKETDHFMPPILDPNTEVEHQLDHYVLWMVIFTFNLTQKPQNWAGNETLLRCYPCIYSYKNGTYNSFPCHVCCPLVLDWNYSYCGSAYKAWLCEGDLDAAYAIAHLEWRDV